MKSAITTEQVLETIVKGLVDFPDKAKVSKHEAGESTVLLVIHTDPSDVGKILGKGGSTLDLLRSLTQKVAAARKIKVLVEIDDPKGR